MESNHTLAAFVRAGGGVELRDVPLPQLERGAIRVKMMASGVCGTDLEKLTGRGITSSVLGHEVAGVVTGSRTEEFQVGDRVIPHHHVACGQCNLCKAGAGTMCEGFRTSNFIPGGFSEEFVVPAYNVSRGGVHKIEDDLSFEEASFAEPLACCIRGLAHAGAFSNPPDTVLIVGAGPIGLLHMEIIRSMIPGVKISAVDIMSSRLDFAERKEGAFPVKIDVESNGGFSETAWKNTNGVGFDLAIVATGNPAAFGESMKCIRKSGRLLLFGAPHKGSTHSLDLSNFFLNELAITSSYSTTETELGQAIELLQGKKIAVRKFITSEFPLRKIEEAMSSARNETQVKVIVIP
jgi:L-iditol 2-dehydrogenase